MMTGSAKVCSGFALKHSLRTITLFMGNWRHVLGTYWVNDTKKRDAALFSFTDQLHVRSFILIKIF